MRLCIDASNIRSGGSVTHLHEVLRCADPPAHGFTQVVVWSCRKTLDLLADRPWLVKRTAPVLERDFLQRALWQWRQLGRSALADGCGLVFTPGGSFATPFRPVVTMSRNMLPFEPAEAGRYGLSGSAIKLALLRRSLTRSMRQASGTIFLTRYARETITRCIGRQQGLVATVPHGVSARFTMPPRPQRALSEYSVDHPFRLVYVSAVDMYKHQIEVAEAVAALRAQGCPVTLDLIGPAFQPATTHMTRELRRLDPGEQFLRFHGPVPYARLHECYAQADAAVFASSCENMPNILLEKMSAGLPIACARKGPMPEILGDAGVYFDPDSPASVADALRQLLAAPDLRARLAARAHEQARAFSWQRCAEETFTFLAQVARQHAATRAA